MGFTFGIGTNQTIGNPFNLLDRNRPRNMVFYGRVSTEHEAQLSALENQIQWYDDQAKHHSNWTVIDKYIDEGITGTQAKKRPAFLRMIEDARKGKFDLIVTREVCRFARNTVDTLVTTRELKNMGIEVYFVEDNIWTMDGDGELRLTIMATLAQEESRKVSERVKAGQMISREKHTVYGNGNILGYNRVGGSYVINEEQAETVRMIFDMYINKGLGGQKISKELTRLGRKNASGLVKWDPGVISRIISNATYMGYQAYGKSYSNNYLEQKRVFNFDTSTYMYVKADFEPIISEEDWKKADKIHNERVLKTNDGKHKHGYCPSLDLWTNKLKCRCGSSFRREVWHKNKTFTTYAYRCYNVVNNGSAKKREELGQDSEGYCNMPTFAEWKFDIMADVILDEIWGNRNNAIELAFNLIRESYRSENSSGGVTAMPNIVSEIDMLKTRRQELIKMRSEREIERDEFLKERDKVDSEIKQLEEKLEGVKNSREEAQEDEFDWIGLKNRLFEIADRKKSMKEIMKDLVYKIVPEGKNHFCWYMNLNPEEDLITQINVDCNGRSGNAIVNISEEGTGKKFPLPVYIGNTTTLRKFKKDILGATAPGEAIPHRQLLRSRGNNPGKPLKIAQLTVDEAYAREFIKTAPSVHHFKTSQWKDIRIDILI